MKLPVVKSWRIIQDKVINLWGIHIEVSKGVMLASLFINLLALVFPMALLQVYDRIIPNAAYQTLLILVLVVLFALILEAYLRIARTMVSGWADARFEHLTGCRAFEHLLSTRINKFEAEGAGTHLESLASLNSLKDFYGGQAITAVFDLPFVFVFLLLIAYIGGWVVLVPITLLIIFAIIVCFMGQRLRILLENRRQQEDRRLNFIVEVLGGIHTVKSLAMEAQMLRRYERLQKTGSVTNYFLSLRGGKGAALTFVMTQLSMIALVGVGSLSVIAGTMTIGGLAACTILTGRSLQPVGRAMGIWSRLQAISIAEKRLSEIEKLPQEKQISSSTHETITGKLEFIDVSFAYEGQASLLDKVNLCIQPKETVAIVGPNQSGKTSLMNLILGMVQPDAGQIKIDDKDVSEYELQDLRQQIAYLPQQGVLFEGTIMQNLTMFRDEYREQAIAISQRFALYDEISHLPKGFDTLVGNRAVEMVSRGIIQRIVIVRALLLSPPIALFDEANTSVDVHADRVLKNMLNTIKSQQTLIIISHRPSLIDIADTVYHIKGKTLVKDNQHHLTSSGSGN